MLNYLRERFCGYSEYRVVKKGVEEILYEDSPDANKIKSSLWSHLGPIVFLAVAAEVVLVVFVMEYMASSYFDFEPDLWHSKDLMILNIPIPIWFICFAWCLVMVVITEYGFYAPKKKFLLTATRIVGVDASMECHGVDWEDSKHRSNVVFLRKIKKFYLCNPSWFFPSGYYHMHIETKSGTKCLFPVTFKFVSALIDQLKTSDVDVFNNRIQCHGCEADNKICPCDSCLERSKKTDCDKKEE
jgi:hypothetical protein